MANDDLILVSLGNRHGAATVVVETDDETGVETTRQDPFPAGKRSTDVLGRRSDGDTVASIFLKITDPKGIWQYHTIGEIGDPDLPGPAWVASNIGSLAELLGDHYQCEVRELEGIDLEMGRRL